MSITSKEIAAICGVSRGTVDRALNGKPGIKPATKATILRTAAEYGYSPDYIGRSLVKGRTFSLGVIVFDLKNPYFSQLLNAIAMQARMAGYAVMIMMSENSVANEIQAVKSLRERRVDGLILHPVGFGPEYEAVIAKAQLPIVVVGNRLSPQFDFISIDNRAAAAEATNQILCQGYKRIIFVAPPLRKDGQVNISAQKERQAGFLSVVEAQHIPFRIIASAGYLDELQPEISGSGQPTAIFCSSDVFALEVQYALNTGRLQAGQPLGLIGFDNIDVLKYIRPQLTTIQNPIAEIGARAVDRLLSRIGNKQLPGQEIIIQHQLICGETLPDAR